MQVWQCWIISDYEWYTVRGRILLALERFFSRCFPCPPNAFFNQFVLVTTLKQNVV